MKKWLVTGLTCCFIFTFAGSALAAVPAAIAHGKVKMPHTAVSAVHHSAKMKSAHTLKKHLMTHIKASKKKVTTAAKVVHHKKRMATTVKKQNVRSN